MKQITQETVLTTWAQMNQLPEKEATKRFKQFSDAQPGVIAYLLAVDEEVTPEGERGDLLFLGLFIWESFRAAGLSPTLVVPEAIEAAEETNTKFLTGLDEGSEHGMFDAVRQLMQNYNQMPLLGGLLEILMSENAEEPEMAGDNVGVALLHLKTVIDTLDQ
jgi:hypothetical protein